MDEMKDKVKGLMKKVNNPFSSSSSGKFKGQGRVLGSPSSSSGPVNQNLGRGRVLGSSSSSSGPVNQNLGRGRILGSSSSPPVNQNPPRSSQNGSINGSNPSPRPPTENRSPATEPAHKTASTTDKTNNQPDGFDPFGTFISSGRGPKNGISVSVFECPVCGSSFKSEEEVCIHVENCLSNSVQNSEITTESSDSVDPRMELRSGLAGNVGVFMSGMPSKESIDVLLKLLRNIIKEPGNEKFRRIRMSNPRIRDAVGNATGGMELLECVGFKFTEEGEETWATMEMPTEEQSVLIKEAILLLEPRNSNNSLSVTDSKTENPVEQKKIDRQVQVFFSVPESVAAKINLPDSFYNLSAEEVKREADLRKKKIAESQLLIPKSYKEKQAKAAKRRYKAAVIRIQFPDGVVLQGIFLPWEPTTVLYEFVSSSLKEPALEYELLQPAVPKSRVVPRFPGVGERPPTLEEVDLVPAALIKFKPIETADVVFTGLRNELIEVSEPLTVA